jgi:hypothetical protein
VERGAARGTGVKSLCLWGCMLGVVVLGVALAPVLLLVGGAGRVVATCVNACGDALDDHGL